MEKQFSRERGGEFIRVRSVAGKRNAAKIISNGQCSMPNCVRSIFARLSCFHLSVFDNMRKWLRIVSVIAFAGAVSGLIWLGVWVHGRRLIQGKTEAEWIRSLDVNPSANWQPKELVAQWHALGPEGIRILCKALNKGIGPMHYRYEQFYQSGLGNVLERILPAPIDSSAIRRSAASLLYKMGLDAKSGVSAMVRALKNEPNEDVRMEIVAALNEDMLRGNEREKAALLPLLIRDTHANFDWGLRVNAVWGLGLYPERREVVVPALIDALKDTEADVRGAAVAVLQKMAPDAAKPEIARAIITMLQKQEEPFFLPGRVELLGNLGTNASAAVPALLEAIKGTNSAVAEAAAHALKKIDPEAAAKAGVQ